MFIQPRVKHTGHRSIKGQFRAADRKSASADIPDAISVGAIFGENFLIEARKNEPDAVPLRFSDARYFLDPYLEPPETSQLLDEDQIQWRRHREDCAETDIGRQARRIKIFHLGQR